MYTQVDKRLHMHTHLRTNHPDQDTEHFIMPSSVLGPFSANTHSCSSQQRPVVVPLGVGHFLWRTLLCQFCLRWVSDLRGPPFNILPQPHLTFTALGSPSYFLVQSKRSLRVSENMKSMCLKSLVPFQRISEKKKGELFKTRSPCSKTVINNMTINIYLSKELKILIGIKQLL